MVITTRGTITAGRITLRRVEEGGSVEGAGSLNVAVKSIYPSADRLFIIHSLYGQHGREVIVTPTVKKKLLHRVHTCNSHTGQLCWSLIRFSYN